MLLQIFINKFHIRLFVDLISILNQITLTREAVLVFSFRRCIGGFFLLR